MANHCLPLNNHDLCCRCGGCAALCPAAGAIVMTDDGAYPRFNADACLSCGLCEQICPGPQVNFTELYEQVFSRRDAEVDYDGLVRAAWIGHAADDRLRKGGVSGGVVTAILSSLLASGAIAACLVTRMNQETPWHGEPFIARSPEDLRMSQTSHYLPIPVNRLIAKLAEIPGKVAVVALPCQVHGLRMMARALPHLGEKIHLIIGLICAGTLDSHFTPEILAAHGIRLEDVSSLKFRAGGWPGWMRVVMKNGSTRQLHYSDFKDGLFNLVISIYMPPRCQTCLDGTAELADISAGDAWNRDETGRYLYQASTKLLIRSERGAEVMATILQAGAVVGDYASDHRQWKMLPMQKRRKAVHAPLRLARLRAKGIAVPLYDRPGPKASIRDRLAERSVSFFLWLGKFPAMRRLALRLITSKLVLPIIFLRGRIKKHRLRQRR